MYIYNFVNICIRHIQHSDGCYTVMKRKDNQPYVLVLVNKEVIPCYIERSNSLLVQALAQLLGLVCKLDKVMEHT